ncbi:hypothetical protein JOC86_004144 [Bacillus pakistanensis]|uniref:Inner membrane protein YgaP-like transmembrane domain-containing protein n=1 Tax=Rossellomorea pakistanensis TaxID=992288 RepID=A0ABS2NIB5_9BACI|nr:DUF2892 domain-containing protein [Bacillus pakistanensis]MBM7587570.1 hypothetical protein [Bacillus pakistanensis]
MKGTSNIGIINALIRITIGLTVLSWSTAKLVRKPWRDSYLLMALVGAMKVGEGILKYCPITELFEKGQGSSPDLKNMLNLGTMFKGKKQNNGSNTSNDFTNKTVKKPDISTSDEQHMENIENMIDQSLPDHNKNQSNDQGDLPYNPS